jgi:PAS domain S-box-containing protein
MCRSRLADLHQAQDLLRVESVRLRTLINSIHVAILVLDEQFRIAEVNATALKLMGIDAPPSSLVGLSLPELMADRWKADVAVVGVTMDFARRTVTGGVPVQAEEIQLPDGTVVEADYLPIDIDGVVRGHLMVGRDVTERVAAQRVLEARDQEQADLASLKSEFLATISHELRTPLTAASSLLDLLPEVGGTGSVQGEIVEALRRNTDRLLTIIEDLLVLARMESHSLRLDEQPVDLTSLLGEVVAGSARLVRDGGQAVVIGDSQWLARMIDCIVSGALATSSQDRTVTVYCTVADNRWIMEVFGLQASTVDGRVGTGLRMSLARAIAERHGGEVRTTVAADRGAAIRVSLPAQTIGSYQTAPDRRPG